MTAKRINDPPYHKILVVDDEMELCNLVQEFLAEYDVVVTSDIPQAIALYQEQKFFLVIVDYQLGKNTNGVQLVQELIQRFPDKTARFCLITGFGEKSVVEQAINSGFHAYLEKPFKNNALLELVEREFQLHKRDIDEEQVMIQTFFEEAGEFLDNLEILLMTLAQAPENLKQIKRILHTLKGMSGLFNDFKQIEQICHHTENILPRNLDSKEQIAADLIDVLVLACDETRSLISRLRVDRSYRIDLTMLLPQISLKDEIEKPEALKSNDTERGAKTAASGALPTADKIDSGKKDGIYIPAGTLDQFMRSIGELISVRNFLENVLFDPLVSLDTQSYRQRIGDIYAQLSTLCHQLHNDVMDIRKVPIKEMFKPYLRIVRNLAIRNDKQIAMLVNDHDILVDTNIIKHLSDALIHIIKNSIDHGIEKPAERVALGKPAHGTILIEIDQDRSHTFITISDDGRGLNTQKILGKALAGGIISERTAAAMSKEEIYALALLPGFSTADTISEMSGRGIGLDAVKRAADDLSGSLAIESTLGQRTAIKLTIPQIKTININRMIIYRLRDQMFASKLQDIRFITSRKQVKISKYDNEQAFIDFNGEYINIAKWRPLADIGGDKRGSTENTGEVAIIFYRGKESIAILVDELLDISQLVVGELSECIDIAGFSGKTILKTGKPALIITPQDLIAA